MRAAAHSARVRPALAASLSWLNSMCSHYAAAFGSLAILTMILFVWELASRAGLIPRILVAAPTSVVTALRTLVGLPRFPLDVWTTTVETLSGFAIGSALGVGIGVGMAYVAFFRRVFQPYVVAFQVVPKVTLVPLFVTFFGFGILPKIVRTSVMAFFPVLVNTVAALDSVGADQMLLMRSLVATRRQIFFKLAWPAVLAYVFAGLKTGLTLAMTGAIVAEFVSAADGLGALVMKFSADLNVNVMFAAIVVNCVLVLRSTQVWSSGNIDWCSGSTCLQIERNARATRGSLRRIPFLSFGW